MNLVMGTELNKKWFLALSLLSRGVGEGGDKQINAFSTEIIEILSPLIMSRFSMNGKQDSGENYYEVYR